MSWQKQDASPEEQGLSEGDGVGVGDGDGEGEGEAFGGGGLFAVGEGEGVGLGIGLGEGDGLVEGPAEHSTAEGQSQYLAFSEYASPPGHER